MKESVLVPDVNTAVWLLTERLAPGDVVLVEAFRSARLDRAADARPAGPASTIAAGGGHA